MVYFSIFAKISNSLNTRKVSRIKVFKNFKKSVFCFTANNQLNIGFSEYLLGHKSCMGTSKDNENIWFYSPNFSYKFLNRSVKRSQKRNPYNIIINNIFVVKFIKVKINNLNFVVSSL